MKILKLKNSKQIKEAFNSTENTEELKKIKENLFKNQLKTFQWSKLKESDTVEADLSTVDFCLIPCHFNKGLVVVDADNEEAVKLIKNNLKPTLTHKTLKGCHFYYKCDLPNLKFSKNDKHIDIFTSNDTRLIFEASNTNYYKRVENGIYEPVELSSDEIDFLKNLSNLITVNDGRHFTNNPYLAMEAYKIIEGKMSPEEFNLIISHKYGELKNILGGRNNFLNSMLWRYGGSGYIENPDDLKELIYKINSFLPEPLETAEINQTVLHKNKFVNFVYKSEAVAISEQPIEDEDLLTKDCFIGIDITNPNATTKFLIIDTRNDKLEISEYGSEKALLNLISDIKINKYRMLERKHFAVKFTKEGPKLYLLPTKCVKVKIFENESYRKNLFEWDEGILNIHTGYYTYNPKIEKKLNSTPEYSENEIQERVKETRQYKVFTQNLIPDREIFIKWCGDLQYILKTKSYLINSLVIKDINGSTGKDSVMTPFLSTILLNKSEGLEYDKHKNCVFDSNLTGQLAKSDCASFLRGQFTEYGNSPLFILNEDGDLNESEYDKLNQKLKTLIKSPTIRTRDLYQKAAVRKSRLYVIRYTNSSRNVFTPGDTNTRMYISNAQQNISLEDWQEMFPNEDYEMTDDEIDRWLDFLLYTDFYTLGYKGISDRPNQSDELENEDDIETILSNRESSVTPDEDATRILEYFINRNEKTVNIENCRYITKEKNHILYNIAKQIELIQTGGIEKIGEKLVKVQPEKPFELNIKRTGLSSMFKKAGFSPGRKWAASVERYLCGFTNQTRLKVAGKKYQGVKNDINEPPD